MTKYFASKSIKVIEQRGSGPDLLIDGKAIEVKGSRYDFCRMLRQLVDYAYKYSDVAVALPFDGLTLEKAHQVHILAQMIEETRNIRLKVYIVAPDSAQKNQFYVREFKTASYVWTLMGIYSFSSLGLDMKNPDLTIREAVENLIKYYSPIKILKENVCTEYTRDVSKVKIDI